MKEAGAEKNKKMSDDAGLIKTMKQKRTRERETEENLVKVVAWLQAAVRCRPKVNTKNKKQKLFLSFSFYLVACFFFSSLSLSCVGLRSSPPTTLAWRMRVGMFPPSDMQQPPSPSPREAN